LASKSERRDKLKKVEGEYKKFQSKELDREFVPLVKCPKNILF